MLTTQLYLEIFDFALGATDAIKADLVHATALDLVDAVDDQSWDHR